MVIPAVLPACAFQSPVLLRGAVASPRGQPLQRPRFQDGPQGPKAASAFEAPLSSDAASLLDGWDREAVPEIRHPVEETVARNVRRLL